MKLEKIIRLEEEEKDDLEKRGVNLKGITREAQWTTGRIKFQNEIIPDIIRKTWEWKSLVRMLGDKRLPDWNKEEGGTRCKECEKEFETKRGLICHLAKTQKRKEEDEEELHLNTECEEREDYKEPGRKCI